MYKNLIKRRIGALVEEQYREREKERQIISFFSNSKRKEIIVWMRLNGNKDKDQIQELIQDKFHVSVQDADHLFYEAFPEGLDIQEEELLDDLDQGLLYALNMHPSVIPDTINVLMKKAPETILDQYDLVPLVKSQIKVVLRALLKKRALI